MLAGVGIDLTIALKDRETTLMAIDYSIALKLSANKQIWWKTLR
jgi:hypothetical protein